MGLGKIAGDLSPCHRGDKPDKDAATAPAAIPCALRAGEGSNGRFGSDFAVRNSQADDLVGRSGDHRCLVLRDDRATDATVGNVREGPIAAVRTTPVRRPMAAVQVRWPFNLSKPLCRGAQARGGRRIIEPNPV